MARLRRIARGIGLADTGGQIVEDTATAVSPPQDPSSGVDAGLISWLTSPEITGEWSRFTGYFAPRKAAYDLPEMAKYLAEHPDAKVALDQLKFAVPWFDTFNTVAVCKAMEDHVQAILSAKTSPADASAAAQKAADELLRPYVNETALKAVG